MKYSRTTTLRFPLLFGGFLSLVGLALVYKHNWLGDIEAERSKLYKENIENRKIIENFKNFHGR